MKEKIYLFSNPQSVFFIKTILSEFDVVLLEEQNLNDNNFINNNVLAMADKKIEKVFSKFFISNNNVLVFYTNNLKENEENNEVKYFYGPIKVKKFFDIVKSNFLLKTVFILDIKIIGENIINFNADLKISITALEKRILIELNNNKKVNRDYFMENILQINKNAETKTIESHLTRIRKKLLKVRSKIRISSKDDVFYFEDLR